IPKNYIPAVEKGIIDHREAGQVAISGSLDNAFLHGGDVVLGNRAAEDLVGEFEVPAARQRLHPDPTIAELSMAAGLLLVTPLHFSPPANRLAIRNLRSFQHDFHAVAFLQ